ncbi:MAG: hypothetical protein M0Q88_07955 [Bacilli bacterium]|nr:hypothetical protein [Bacilli bacterium]
MKTLLITPKTVNKGDMVGVFTEDRNEPYEVIYITSKTLILKGEDRKKKIAYWSERKSCYSVDNKYQVV